MSIFSGATFSTRWGGSRTRPAKQSIATHHICREPVSSNSRYVHDFTSDQHAKLAATLTNFKRARVVVSYYDSLELDQLYGGWTKLDCSRHKHLHVQNKRGSERSLAPEVLLINGEAVAEEMTGQPMLGGIDL